MHFNMCCINSTHTAWIQQQLHQHTCKAAVVSTKREKRHQAGADSYQYRMNEAIRAAEPSPSV